MKISKDLLVMARDMAKRGRPGGSRTGRPKRVYLNRAISAAYQAIFLTICESTADLLIGTKSKSAIDAGWMLAYRSVDHGKARNVCSSKKLMSIFSQGIKAFAEIFTEGQEKPYLADYAYATFKLEDVLDFIDKAEKGIEGFKASKKSERKAFVSLIAFNKRNT